MIHAFLIYERFIKIQSYYDLRDTYTYTEIPHFRENDNVKIVTVSLKPSRSPSLRGHVSLTGGMPMKLGFGRLQQVPRGGGKHLRKHQSWSMKEGLRRDSSLRNLGRRLWWVKLSLLPIMAGRRRCLLRSVREMSQLLSLTQGARAASVACKPIALTLPFLLCLFFWCDPKHFMFEK